MNLTELQVRVIGALMEKEKTTPDQYPLSLNSLTNACNQKSSREPVMQLSEDEVKTTVDELISENLVAEVVFGSRVAKYKHRFCNTEFSPLQLSSKEQAIICVLFLRGAQTAGEIKTRTQRLCDFSNVSDVDKVLQDVISSDTTYLVKELPREPGKREIRFTHVFDSSERDAFHTSAVRPETLEKSEDTEKTEAAKGIDHGDADYQTQIDALEARIEKLETLWQELND